MKAYFIILAVISLSASISYAGNQPRWDAIPRNTKEILVKSYVSGYLSGMNRGISEGINSAINYTKKVGDNTYIDSTPNIYTTCSNMINSNLDRIYDDTRGWQQLQPKDPQFYVDDMTAFLKKYPRCNSIDVSDLIEILTPIWLNIEKKKGYEEVGLGCSK